MNMNMNDRRKILKASPALSLEALWQELGVVTKQEQEEYGIYLLSTLFFIRPTTATSTTGGGERGWVVLGRV